MITNNLINSFILGVSFVLILLFLTLLGNIFLHYSKIKKKYKIIIILLISILLLIKNVILFIEFLKLPPGQILNSHHLIIDIILIFSGLIAVIIEYKFVDKKVLLFTFIFLIFYLISAFFPLPLIEAFSEYGIIFSVFVLFLGMIIEKN